MWSDYMLLMMEIKISLVIIKEAKKNSQNISFNHSTYEYNTYIGHFPQWNLLKFEESMWRESWKILAKAIIVNKKIMRKQKRLQWTTKVMKMTTEKEMGIMKAKRNKPWVTIEIIKILEEKFSMEIREEKNKPHYCKLNSELRR